MKFILLLFTFVFTQSALAGGIKWEGNYRIEALKVFNPATSDSGTDKGYILHHLTLKPTITAFDGLTIHSRFDILNNGRHPNSQLGQVFGDGVNNNPTSPAGGTSSPPAPGNGTNAGNSNTLSGNLASGYLAINELYANWNQEFGVLTVGRAPMHFGLGIQFNAGRGPFDHWLENRDLIAYRITSGNFSFMPVIAKSYEGLLDQEDDVNDYILQIDYRNPDTELEVGFIYQARRSTSNPNSNDTPVGPIGGTGVPADNYEVDTYNLYMSQWVDNVKIAFEVGFMSGNTGVFAPSGSQITQDGFGGAVQISWMPETSNWGLEFDLGYASGDDPTTDTFEGYIFDRNYDIAFLLFNHPMGQADFFRTSYLSNQAAGGVSVTAVADHFDTEAISNTIFASAGVHYKWAENKYDLESRLTWAQLAVDPLGTGTSSNVGLELDVGLTYKPFKGFQWINRAGYFMPGAAFEGGTNNFSTSGAFGFETKAAISF